MNKPESTALTKPKILPADIKAKIEENKARNAVVAAIRGTIWGKDISQEQVRAVAQYCRETGVDPVRHVEVLGGRIYLTAEFYMEKGAALIQRGDVILHPTDFIQADPRLDTLAAKGGDAGTWAVNESNRRLMERVKHGAPDAATAIAVVRITVRSTGATFEGVNWCGGGTRKKMITDRASGKKILIDADPIGDLEPVKTAETRAARRAWRKIVRVLPELDAEVRQIEARATMVGEEIMEIHAAEPKALPRPALAQDENEIMPPIDVQRTIDDPYAEDAA